MPMSPSLTSSPRQLVQALRLSAAPQRPPNPATLLTLRVKILEADIFETTVPLVESRTGLTHEAPGPGIFFNAKQ